MHLCHLLKIAIKSEYYSNVSLLSTEDSDYTLELNKCYSNALLLSLLSTEESNDILEV